jgi:hypothetical protein
MTPPPIDLIRRRLYIRDGDGDPLPCEDRITWAQWHEDHTSHLASTYIEVGIPPVTSRVSTIFLGVDFAFHGPPLIFETRVIGGTLDGEQERYTFLVEARRGHEAMCQRIRDLRLLPPMIETDEPSDDDESDSL